MRKMYVGIVDLPIPMFHELFYMEIKGTVLVESLTHRHELTHPLAALTADIVGNEGVRQLQAEHFPCGHQ